MKALTYSGPQDVLVVVDIQNDFCPGGNLAVPNGDEVVPLINRLAERFATVVLTQDWHPPGHRSFASAHPGHRPYDTIDMPYGPQVLWPDHCVQDTPGAELRRDLRVPQHRRGRVGGGHAGEPGRGGGDEGDGGGDRIA